MELYQLKTFIEVAKEGHLTRAASNLHTSQPAVSAHIKALEQELDIRLFDRTPKGMALTLAGTRLLDQAKAILKNVRDIKFQAEIIKSKPLGIVKLGLNIDPVHLMLDALLSDTRHRYPGIEFHLIQKMSWEALEEIRSGKLDCAFVYGRPGVHGIGGLHLKSFDVVVAAPFEWNDKIKEADWKTLGDLPWIMTPHHCGFNAIAKDAFEKVGIKPLRVAVADEETTIQRLVVSGAGVTLMIKDEARPLAEKKKLALWDHKVASLALYFVFLEDRKNKPTLKAVIDSVKSVWETQSEREKSSTHEI